MLTKSDIQRIFRIVQLYIMEQETMCHRSISEQDINILKKLNKLKRKENICLVK